MLKNLLLSILFLVLSYHAAGAGQQVDINNFCQGKANHCFQPSSVLDSLKVLCESKRRDLGCDQLFQKADEADKPLFFSCNDPESLCENFDVSSQWTRFYSCASGAGGVLVDSVLGIVHLPRSLWELAQNVPTIPDAFRNCHENHQAKLVLLGALRPKDMSDESINAMSCQDISLFVQTKTSALMTKLEARRQALMATSGKENLSYFEMQLSDSEFQALNFSASHSGRLKTAACLKPDEAARVACEEITKASLTMTGVGVGVAAGARLVQAVRTGGPTVRRLAEKVSDSGTQRKTAPTRLNASAGPQFKSVSTRFNASPIVEFYGPSGRVSGLSISPGESFTAIIRDGKLLLGKNIPGTTGRIGGSGSHINLMKLSGAEAGESFSGSGGAIRFNGDGSIDISGYHSLTKSAEASDKLTTLIKSIAPESTIRATPDRLSTLP